MRCPFYLVDAFTVGPFTGNPAGVCLLESEAPEPWMQTVASEMNQAETAFVWPSGASLGLRWFTPAVEVDLCGHATLATTHALLESGRIQPGAQVEFLTKSGALKCWSGESRLCMDFPAEAPEPTDWPSVASALELGNAVWKGRNRMDWMVELASEADVLALRPDFGAVHQMGLRGLIVTAKASRDGVDFVSRFFAPQSGIPEDHVTGSAHCALGPYWSERLGKAAVTGYQASPRGGMVGVEVKGARVVLSGTARTVVEGFVNG